MFKTINSQSYEVLLMNNDGFWEIRCWERLAAILSEVPLV